MKNKILVIGGTGTVGNTVVTELKNNNADYVVLTRSKEKATELKANDIPAITGTLGEWSTVESAFEGVNTVFLATSPAENMLDLHKGAIDLSVRKGINKIVRLSAESTNNTDDLHMYKQHDEADTYLKQSGLEYVILRPHYFMQNMFMHIDSVKAQNIFAQYSGGAKFPMIDVRDIAKAAFQALTKDEFNNQIFVLSGPKAIGYDDVANNLTHVLGRNIQYVDLSFEEQEAGFKAYGLPDWQLNSVMKVFKIWADEGILEPTNDFETITNSKAISIEEFVDDYSQYFK